MCLYQCCVGEISSQYMHFYNFLMCFLLFNCINTSQYTYLSCTFYILTYFIVILSMQTGTCYISRVKIWTKILWKKRKLLKISRLTPFKANFVCAFWISCAFFFLNIYFNLLLSKTWKKNMGNGYKSPPICLVTTNGP